MSASTPQPKQSNTPPANVRWLVAIIIGVLVVGTAVAILAARAAGLGHRARVLWDARQPVGGINLPGVIPLAQASKQATGQAAAAPDANKNIIAHGSHVQIYSQNVIDFGTQLDALAVQMAGAPDIGAAQSLAGQLQPLADALLNGMDADGDGVIEAGPGEGGARDAYNHAQYMAAMGVAFGEESP